MSDFISGSQGIETTIGLGKIRDKFISAMLVYAIAGAIIYFFFDGEKD